MKLMEEDFQEKNEKNGKVLSRVILGIIIFLILVTIGITVYMFYLEDSTLKLYLNGEVNESLKQKLVIEEDGTIYVPIKDIAKDFGYESYNGEYTEKSENESKCYVQNENEVANFSLESNKIYKLDLTTSNEIYEYVYTEKPVKAISGKLYATSEAIEKAFNVSFQYDQEKNRIYVYTMPYLINVYSTKILDYGYTKISEVFANQKIVLQNMLVVQKDENRYAVINVDGTNVLEAKYENITYLPNVGDFLIENNNKLGIMSKNGETKVQIMYDSIELMDSDAGLYVVKKDNKYGVLDLNGEVKIYIENDEIGMDISKFEKNNIKNKYLLAENLIPARKGELWGLYDKNGNKVVDYIYDSFGYLATSNKGALNLLVIPEYDVLVACKDEKYTLLNSNGKELFNAGPIADAIYMTINSGKRQYWIAVNNGEMDAEKYLDNIGVKAKTKNTQTQINSTNTTSSTNSSNVTNSTNTENKSTLTNTSKNEEESNTTEPNE